MITSEGDNRELTFTEEPKHQAGPNLDGSIMSIKANQVKVTKMKTARMLES